MNKVIRVVRDLGGAALNGFGIGLGTYASVPHILNAAFNIVASKISKTEDQRDYFARYAKDQYYKAIESVTDIMSNAEELNLIHTHWKLKISNEKLDEMLKDIRNQG